MWRRHFLTLRAGAGALLEPRPPAAQAPEWVYSGVSKFTLGSPQKITPTATPRYAPAAAGFSGLPAVTACPVPVTGTCNCSPSPYIQNPPWKQVNRADNIAGRLDPHWEQIEARCRAILELRMPLVPYIHAAFVLYHRERLPPFRAGPGLSG